MVLHQRHLGDEVCRFYQRRLGVPPGDDDMQIGPARFQCRDNALEWKEFEPKFDRRDVDFKWLYRLFAPNAGGSILAALGRKELPYPLLNPRGARTTGNTGCTGGKITPPK